MNTGRFAVLLTLFVLAAAFGVVRGCRIAGPERARIIAKVEKNARVRRNIPARRGRILDRNGAVLVWSEMYCDLYYSAAGENELSEDEQQTLIDLFGKLDFSTRPRTPLRRHLTPDELIALEPLLVNGAPLVVKVRQERLALPSPAVRKAAGLVELHDGVQCGVSGWELRYDLQLRGVPGSFSVLLDRFGNYIPKSFRLSGRPSNGRDVKIESTLAEIEAEKEPR